MDYNGKIKYIILVGGSIVLVVGASFYFWEYKNKEQDQPANIEQTESNSATNLTQEEKIKKELEEMEVNSSAETTLSAEDINQQLEEMSKNQTSIWTEADIRRQLEDMQEK